jgi:glutathione gamma-glutamylcysteinyltransferase
MSQPSATDASFYRRPLPPTLVPFASEEGRALFREALAEGHMEGWFALAEQFHTQADPAFCGLGTLVVALNALGVDPGRLWKGPWRWYSEELLDCCLTLDDVRDKGVTLDQFACLARCNGATTQTRRAGDATLATFRADLRAAASSPGLVLAAAYSRRTLGQTGDGHFSPVAAFHEASDLALVLDVARFKYPPHWVPVPALWEAMRPHDPATGRPRGWVLLRRRPEGSTVLFRLSNTRLPWADVTRRLLVDVPAALQTAAPATARAAVDALVAALSPELLSVLEAASTALGEVAPEHRAQSKRLLDDLRATDFHREVEQALAARAEGAGAAPGPSEFVAMLLLALPDAALRGLPDAARAGLDALRRLDTFAPPLRAEVATLREQLAALDEVYGEGAMQGCASCS